MSIEPIEIVNSIFSLLAVIVFALVGLIIILRYFQYKNKTLLLMGIAWAMMGLPWVPSSVALIVYLSTNQFLPLWLYLILGYPLIPIYLILFSTVLTQIKYKERQKQVFLVFLLFGIIFEILFITFLIIDPLILAEPTSSPVDIDFGGFMMGYLVIALLISVIMGILIAKESLKSDDPDVKLKGKFILLAFIIFLIAAALDALLPITFIALPIVRILLISTAILFYIGLFTPEWLKKRILKEK